MKTRYSVLIGALAGAVTLAAPACKALMDAEAELRTARAHVMEEEARARAAERETQEVQRAGWHSFNDLLEAYDQLQETCE